MSTDYQSAPLLPHYTAGGELSEESPRMQRVKRVAKIVAPAALIGTLLVGAACIFNTEQPPAVNNASVADSAVKTAFGPSEADDQPLITRELIQHIRSSQNTWTPVDDEHQSPFREWTLSRFRKLTKRSPEDFDYVPDPRNLADEGTSKHPAPIKNFDGINFAADELPKEFDARVKWADCQSIGTVRDQGACGSCWAFGSVSAMSDRVCIHSNMTYQHLLSAHDLMGCCAYCSAGGKGCDGGDEQDAYHFWMTEGIVSGDLYKSEIGCQPYPIQVSIIHTPGKSQDSPTCQRSCTNNGWKNPYGQDKVKAREVYRLPDNDTEVAMYEIMTNGPISASYTVYDDFPLYKDGVYQHTTEKVTGQHVVVIFGWGEQNGVPFWWAKNSWNRLWGHHGFFKIRRGINECDIEQGMVAGIPDVATLPRPL